MENIEWDTGVLNANRADQADFSRFYPAFFLPDPLDLRSKLTIPSA